MHKIIISLLITYACVTHAIETVLLTGGAGFIGSHTALALLKRGYRVVIIDNLNDHYDPSSYKQLRLEYLQSCNPYPERLVLYTFDLCDNDALTIFWHKEQPSLVCHLAACAGISLSVKKPDLYLQTNIINTLNILELAKKYPIQNFVFASSSSVYGNNSIAPFQESEIADMPCSPYAMSKRAMEMLIYTYHHLYNIPCTGLRFFTVYGPYGRTDMAPFIFLHNIHNNKPIELFGDASTRMRDFTYIDDIVNGIIQALESPHAYEIFNLGRGEPITLKEFVTTTEYVAQKNAIIMHKRVPAGDVDITYADISKAQRMLNYNPQISFQEGMKQTFDWYTKAYLPFAATNT